MPTTCGFPNCRFRSRYRGTEDNRHFYRVPKKPAILRKRWLEAIGRTEETIVSQLRVCSGHFHGGEKREGDIPVADPTVDELIRIELPPKPPRLPSSGMGHRFGVRGTGSTRGSHSQAAKVKMSLFRPGMLNCFSKEAHPLLSHIHKSKSGSVSSTPSFHSQPSVLTTRAKWFSEASEKTRKATGISHISSRKRDRELADTFKPPFQLLNFSQMKHSGERTPQVSFPITLPSSDSAPFSLETSRTNLNFTGLGVPLGSYMHKSLSPTDWRQQQQTQQQLSVPLSSTLQQPTPPAPIITNLFSAFSSPHNPRRFAPDLPMKSSMDYSAHHSATLFKQHSGDYQMDAPGTMTSQFETCEASSTLAHSTPLIHTFTNLLSSGLDIHYYSQILSAMFHPSLVSNPLSSSCTGVKEKPDQLPVEPSQWPMAWSSAYTTKPTSVKGPSIKNSNSVTNTLFMPRVSVSDSTAPALSTSRLDERLFCPESLLYQTEPNQAKLLNLCVRSATNHLGDGPGLTRPTYLNQTRRSPYPTGIGSPKIKPNEENMHSQVITPFLPVESPSTAVVGKILTDDQKLSTYWSGHTSIGQKCHLIEPNMTKHQRLNNSESAVLFLGHSDADVEKPVLQDCFQVYHLSDLEQIKTGTFMQRLTSELTHLVIPPGITQNPEDLIKQMINLKAVFLPELKMTRLQQLITEFPALYIQSISNPLDVDKAADFVITNVLVSLMGHFKFSGGAVIQSLNSSVRHPWLPSIRRPQSWPSTVEKTTACKLPRQAYHEYEDLENERFTRGESFNNTTLRCNYSEDNPDGGNKRAMKGQTVGFLQWSPLTLAVARRLQAFGCVMLVADEQLPSGSDHVFGVTRTADHVHLVTQSDLLLIMDDLTDYWDTKCPAKWSQVKLNASLLKKAKRGCRLFYFGTSMNSENQRILHQTSLSENIAQLVIGPCEQNATSTTVHPNLIHLRESLDDFRLSPEEFRKHIALCVRRHRMKQLTSTIVPSLSTQARFSPRRPTQQNSTNESHPVITGSRIKTLTLNQIDRSAPTGDSGSSVRTYLDIKPDSPYQAHISSTHVRDFHSWNNVDKRKYRCISTEQCINFGVNSLISEDLRRPQTRSEEQQKCVKSTVGGFT
ncbi:Zinc finger C2CH type [Fasciola hepatica]|uniref:Zinc finger C2CH type n=1 Tax=Fasciola hepatica TaxID=6192 RepID=A0A4E0RPN2_FASHE|nr:Zinc finger C2CH type [Fasciola hepatica]